MMNKGTTKGKERGIGNYMEPVVYIHYVILQPNYLNLEP